MLVTAPDWLTRRDCSLRAAPDGVSVAVLFNGEPDYLLTPLPAEGKHTCQIIQTNNGKHLDHGAIYDSPDQAIGGGLEELRKALGW